MTQRVRLRGIEKDKAKQKVFKMLRHLSGKGTNDAGINGKDIEIADHQKEYDDALALKNIREAYINMVILFAILSLIFLTLITAAIMWFYCLPKPKEIEIPLIEEELVVEKVDVPTYEPQEPPVERSPSKYESILSQTRRGTYQPPRENVIVKTTVPTYIDGPAYLHGDVRSISRSPLRRSISPASV